MKDNEADISFYEVADWLWSFRWLMLACALVAVAWIFMTWQNTRSESSTFDIKLQIFSGGTPNWEPGEISDILAARLDMPGLNQVSDPAANPLIYKTSDSQLAKDFETNVAAIVNAMMAEASAQQAELGRLLQQNETALPQYLETKSFIDGVNSGLITPVVTTITPNQVSTLSKATALLAPLVVCGFLFILVAGSITFARGWRKHRRVG